MGLEKMMRELGYETSWRGFLIPAITIFQIFDTPVPIKEKHLCLNTLPNSTVLSLFDKGNDGL